MSKTEQTIELIDKVLPLAHQGRYGASDKECLSYIKSQLQPARVKEREENDEPVDLDTFAAIVKQRAASYAEALDAAA